MRWIPVYQPDESEPGRAVARLFEQALPPERRKRLGQFFTGIRLGKLLGHLAISPETRTVLDPMAGHGDLLDAITEVARERCIQLDCLDGIEIDDETATVCRQRLKTVAGSEVRGHSVVRGNAFDPTTLNQLDGSSYDLVITNPPYVRYQAQNGSDNAVNTTRNGLISIIDARLTGREKLVWQTLAGGYSGLADLSVPSWILAGLLVRPGGRLALVVPATWRTRDYGDVIRYMMLRCFALEIIVEDTQPGWFSDALVRTQLIVARRLTAAEAEERLSDRAQWTAARSISISPDAADQSSLVGTAFRGTQPERHFAQWLTDQAHTALAGVTTQAFNLNDEWRSLQGRAKPRLWLLKLEETKPALPLFREKALPPSIPEAVKAIAGDDLKLSSLLTVERAGISIGQGLRTGCNRFFYVEALAVARDGILLVKASEALGHCEVEIPASAARPVLRKQSELPLIERGEMPAGRVLDLRAWALPEDMETVTKATATYRAFGETPPQAMPDALADFVRRAATTHLDEDTAKFAPDLSAVRTNIRGHREGAATPRFWYMLPNFAPRHLPAAFVGRVNNGTPWVECNFENPFLVDANFSTFWSLDNRWTRFALKALLNSAWCRLFMEALGTPLGGGALKLEAAHLRQLLIPALSEAACRELDQAGRNLKQTSEDALRHIDAVIFTALGENGDIRAARSMADSMMERAETLRRMRQRAAA
jgi:hypothetical protein